MVRHVIEDEIVPMFALGKVLPRVVNDMVRADRPDHVHVSRAAHACYLSSERLGNLHSERSDASRRTIDQDLLPPLNLTSIANGLEGGEASHGNDRSLLKREIFRLGYEVVRWSTRIPGEGSIVPAEHLVAWLKLRNLL